MKYALACAAALVVGCSLYTGGWWLDRQLTIHLHCTDGAVRQNIEPHSIPAFVHACKTLIARGPS